MTRPAACGSGAWDRAHAAMLTAAFTSRHALNPQAQVKVRSERSSWSRTSPQAEQVFDDGSQRSTVVTCPLRHACLYPMMRASSAQAESLIDCASWRLASMPAMLRSSSATRGYWVSALEISCSA